MKRTLTCSDFEMKKQDEIHQQKAESELFQYPHIGRKLDGATKVLDPIAEGSKPGKTEKLYERLSRKELKVTRMLSELAYEVDGLNLEWFEKVFAGWMSPQSMCRRRRMKHFLKTAAGSIRAKPKSA